MTIGSTTFTTSYSYTDVNGVNKAKLQKLMLPNGREISYTYDKNNNIESIKEGSKVVKYSYDGLNQLIREDNGFLGTAGKTITYSYDEGGKLSKNEYPLTTGDNLPTAVKTYEYKYDKVADGGIGWNDKLVKIIVTEDGTPTTYDLSYDKIGNLTSYNGYSYTWEGRQLRTITGNEKNISFKYNSSGIRTEKTVDGKVAKYHLVGDRVTYEETKDSSGTVINKIYYIYNSDDELIAMKLDGVQYNYIRNAQGDIIGLLDSTGAEVVSYTYDSWGKLESIDGTKASTVGVLNPYRYRGYRYDAESGLYYLQSRYYNPEWGGFINADATIGELGQLLIHNLYTYCMDSPITLTDPEGFGGQVIDLGGGWKARIDPAIPDMNLQRHVHVYKGKDQWAQNEDGSPHDKGKNSPGEPPSSKKKDFKKKTGWDWDKKSTEYRDKKKKKQKKNIATGVMVLGGGYLVYRVVRFIPSLAPPLWWTIPGNLACP